ncbi:hypothetical protein PV08_05059 [Exophiala spinifera]|uniref:Inositol polyphosphate-related phosphatase domain-containing protein n=1 Tax=Exophiala spinifera TaxID=91928 RepID=A0A0D2C2K4_9EURO|nr:uncharacterized protein PV08_05059 [Exophiala spinifera]KIW17864.1 hypothetical protein PV08_05059 [Exophiala spinifera]
MHARAVLTGSVLSLVPFLAHFSCAQTSGTFNFLTYNVAGLPAILNGNDETGDKATNAGLIGGKLSSGNFDIVHMQEDFNYHAYIYATDTHPYRTATSGGVPFGSGLNTVANYTWSAFNRITWSQCDINDGDCLTPKGFTMIRLQLTATASIDLYNLHSDAGSNTGDGNARRGDIKQVLSYISAHSAGQAVIIGGDTNDRWTNDDVSLNLLTAAGFSDTWVELINGGVYPGAGTTANPCDVPAASNSCEVVDKVLYRSSSSVSLSATSWTYDSAFFVQPDGDPLSDHNPVLVGFAWSTA